MKPKLLAGLTTAVTPRERISPSTTRTVAASLERDCPVAFLNLHNGLEKRLDWWHWVTITALDGDNVTILDSGAELEIDLRLWYQTSKKRGGLVAALGVDPC